MKISMEICILDMYENVMEILTKKFDGIEIDQNS